MDEHQAVRAAKAGAVAAFISGGLTAVVVLFAMLSNAQGALGYWNDPVMFFDIFFILGCAAGLLRNSRSAAILITVYFLLSKVVIYLETGKLAGLGMSLVFVYFFARAVYGTFVYHRIRKEEEPGYRPASRWTYFIGIPAGIVLFVITGFGAMTLIGVFPSTEVATGADMRQKDRALLIETGIVDPREEIAFFYSHGFLSILEDGNVLTDQRVIRYVKDGANGLKVYQFMFDEIEQIRLIEQGNAVNPSIYEVRSYREDLWVRLALSTEDGGDVKFIEALRDRVHENRGLPAIGTVNRQSL
ncbi:MAG: hypothetical protein GTO40_14235 [Deltaproteobacteria bacterium]|nr:hypothetical protein [Deltaproteobacteria bacterium]